MRDTAGIERSNPFGHASGVTARIMGVLHTCHSTYRTHLQALTTTPIGTSQPALSTRVCRQVPCSRLAPREPNRVMGLHWQHEPPTLRAQALASKKLCFRRGRRNGLRKVSERQHYLLLPHKNMRAAPLVVIIVPPGGSIAAGVDVPLSDARRARARYRNRPLLTRSGTSE